LAYDVLAKTISGGFQQFRLTDAIDIVIIAVLLYHLIQLTKETRAYQVLRALASYSLRLSSAIRCSWNP